MGDAVDQLLLAGDQGIDVIRHLVKRHPQPVQTGRRVKMGTLVKVPRTESLSRVFKFKQILPVRLMERVLDNLVNNALRYSEQRLRIGLWFDGDDACLQVEDDGPGIPPEERERVFEPFVRLDPSRDRATGGCGLGLAIVHSIAVAYQGQVYVDASSLGGACFRFCWPVKPNFNLKADPV